MSPSAGPVFLIIQSITPSSSDRVCDGAAPLRGTPR
jgi:hypothetical protein